MRLRLTRAGRSADVSVTVPDGSTPLATVLAASGVAPVPGRVAIDGRAATTAEPVGALALLDGSTVDLTPATNRTVSGAAELIQIAGDRCANPVPLLPVPTTSGRSAATAGSRRRSSGSVSRPTACSVCRPLATARCDSMG